MIYGVGTDIVQIPRIEKLLSKYGDRFVSRIMNGAEISRYDSLPNSKKPSFIAKRLAAKEAVCKAFGTGFGAHLSLNNIVILNDSEGRPITQIIKSSISNLSEYRISLSISDDYPNAIAFAVVTY